MYCKARDLCDIVQKRKILMMMSMWMTRLIGRGKLYTESPPQQLLRHTAIDTMRLGSAQFSFLPLSARLRIEFWMTWQVCQRSQVYGVCREDQVRQQATVSILGYAQGVRDARA